VNATSTAPSPSSAPSSAGSIASGPSLEQALAVRVAEEQRAVAQRHPTGGARHQPHGPRRHLVDDQRAVDEPHQRGALVAPPRDLRRARRPRDQPPRPERQRRADRLAVEREAGQRAVGERPHLRADGDHLAAAGERDARRRRAAIEIIDVEAVGAREHAARTVGAEGDGLRHGAGDYRTSGARDIIHLTTCASPSRAL
jgi:hypothetical protein